jgi:hypothetical protein
MAFTNRRSAGGRATELSFTQGISYTLRDEKLSAGLEMKFTHETAVGSRSNPEIKFLLGPSLQWRPTPRTHLDLVPLVGLTHDSPRVEAFVVFGFDFWPMERKHEHYAPASLKAN